MKGGGNMRKEKKINVVIHAPEDEESLNMIQEAVDALYAQIVFRELKKYDLTPKEEDKIIAQIIARLEE